MVKEFLERDKIGHQKVVLIGSYACSDVLTHVPSRFE